MCEYTIVKKHIRQKINEFLSLNILLGHAFREIYYIHRQTR